MIQYLKKYKGAIIPILLATAAYAVNHFFGLSIILAALIFGMIYGNLVKIPLSQIPGVAWSSGFILELATVGMAFSINYLNLLELGPSLILMLLGTVIFVLLITIWIGKRFKFNGPIGWLIGFGTAICGSSAIAALAPSVSKNKQDIALSLALVNLLGLIGMIALPKLGLLWFNETELGTLIGLSLHSVGNVVGAGFEVNDSVGELSLMVKLGRVALLTPAIFLFQFLIGSSSSNSQQKVKFTFPWYLIGFVLISIIVTLIHFPGDFLYWAKWISNALLTVAMAAIGLSMKLNKVVVTGKKWLVFASLIFILQLLFIAGLMQVVQ